MCNVCAEPKVDSFFWEFNGETPRHGIVQNVSQIMFSSYYSLRTEIKPEVRLHLHVPFFAPFLSATF